MNPIPHLAVPFAIFLAMSRDIKAVFKNYWFWFTLKCAVIPDMPMILYFTSIDQEPFFNATHSLFAIPFLVIATLIVSLIFFSYKGELENNKVKIVSASVLISTGAILLHYCLDALSSVHRFLGIEHDYFFPNLKTIMFKADNPLIISGYDTTVMLVFALAMVMIIFGVKQTEK